MNRRAGVWTLRIWKRYFCINSENTVRSVWPTFCVSIQMQRPACLKWKLNRRHPNVPDRRMGKTSWLYMPDPQLQHERSAWSACIVGFKGVPKHFYTSLVRVSLFTICSEQRTGSIPILSQAGVPTPRIKVSAGSAREASGFCLQTAMFDRNSYRSYSYKSF